MSKLTYKGIFKFPSLRLMTADFKRYMEQQPIELKFPIRDRSSLVGIEIELENVPNAPNIRFWNRMEDGSLRNYGIEYTSLPVRGQQIEYSLRHLFSALKTIHGYNPHITPRCGVHVHLNARYMTPEQMRNMMLIYLIFERMLFKFVGQDRDKNINCVPLLDCSLLPRLFQLIKLEIPVGSWMKYTAVNFLTLGKIGTIEFRHMHGTDDVEKLMKWINMILSMKIYAYKRDPAELLQEIYSLNTNSQYRQFAVNVFGSLVSDLIDDSSYGECSAFMEEGVGMTKLLISAEEFKNSLEVLEGSGISSFYPITVKREKIRKVSVADFLEENLTLQQNPVTWTNAWSASVAPATFAPPPVSIIMDDTSQGEL